MFSADLSWTDRGADQVSESVGDRKVRKAEKKRSSSAASTASWSPFASGGVSVKRSMSKRSLNTISHKHSISSGIGTLCCSTTSKTASQHKKSMSATTAVEDPLLRDPVKQPDYTISGKVVTNLPSGRPLHEDRAENPWHDSGANEKLLHHTQLETQPANSTKPSPARREPYANSAESDRRTWAIRSKADADAVLQSYDRMREEIRGMQYERPDTFLSMSSSRPNTADSYRDSDPEEPWELAPTTPRQARSAAWTPQTPRTPLTPGRDYPDRRAQANFYLSPTPATDTTVHMDELDPEDAVVLTDGSGLYSDLKTPLVNERHSVLPPLPEEPASDALSELERSEPTTPAHEIPPTPVEERYGVARLPPSVHVSHPTRNGKRESLNKSRWQAPSAWEVEPQHINHQEPRAGSTSSSNQSRSNTSSSPDYKDYKNAAEDLNFSVISDDDSEPDQTPHMSHFLRFIRRMEGAGPKIILDRLKEEWEDLSDEHARDEAMMEKHLWSLTALQLKSLDRFARASSYAMPILPLPPLALNKKRRMLELEGNVGEIFQASALYPNSKICFLQRHHEPYHIPLPSQASIHPQFSYNLSRTLQAPNYPFIPLPFGSETMHHIRSGRLPALLPASQLTSLIKECHRVLRPGGILELRLVDPMPERGTTGPLLLSWLEDRLLLGLEAGFRCTRPIALVPQWVQDAGFQPLPFRNEAEPQHGGGMRRRQNRQSLGRLGLSRCLRLPATTDAETAEALAMAHGNRAHHAAMVTKFVPGGERDMVVSQLGSLVARALWKDCWGEFLIDPSELDDGQDDFWWWEDTEILKECEEWKTVWNVGTLIVAKDG